MEAAVHKEAVEGVVESHWEVCVRVYSTCIRQVIHICMHAHTHTHKLRIC